MNDLLEKYARVDKTANQFFFALHRIEDAEEPYDTWFKDVVRGQHRAVVLDNDVVDVYGCLLKMIRVLGQPTPQKGSVVQVFFDGADKVHGPSGCFKLCYELEERRTAKRDWRYDSEVDKAFNLSQVIRESKRADGVSFKWSVVSPRGSSKEPCLGSLTSHVLLEDALINVKTGMNERLVNRAKGEMLCRAAADKKPTNGYFHLGERHRINCSRCKRLFAAITGKKEFLAPKSTGDQASFQWEEPAVEGNTKSIPDIDMFE